MAVMLIRCVTEPRRGSRSSLWRNHTIYAISKLTSEIRLFQYARTFYRLLPLAEVNVTLPAVASKMDLSAWVRDALTQQGGSASIVHVCRHIWQVHEMELRMSGDLFYTWQYDVRWAAYQLREAGVMKPEKESPKGVWQLV
jgi:hypothetical protein